MLYYIPSDLGSSAQERWCLESPKLEIQHVLSGKATAEEYWLWLAMPGRKGSDSDGDID